jgi:hypothetical protein
MPLGTRWVIVYVVAATCGISPALAQTGGGYSLVWSSLDCGSPAASTGGVYRLRSTVGQAEAGNAAGGPYLLHGGFQIASQTPTDTPPDVLDSAGPLIFRLHGNAPNPFNDRTAIAFSLDSTTGVQLRVVDLAGRLVRTVLERELGPGRHQVDWDGRDATGRRVSQGIYFLHLRAGSLEAHRKMVVLR